MCNFFLLIFELLCHCGGKRGGCPAPSPPPSPFPILPPCWPPQGDGPARGKRGRGRGEGRGQLLLQAQDHVLGIHTPRLGCPSTCVCGVCVGGGGYLQQYYHSTMCSTGPVLKIVLAQYWPSTKNSTGPVLAQY